MINFVGNAIKFTCDGIVQVKLSDYDENQAKVEIIDNGSGIKEEKYFKYQ